MELLWTPKIVLSIILTKFAPTVILNIVGHSSNYSNNLPNTAYIKMIDIWLLFNLIKPFNDILVTTYMDSLRGDDEREINHHGVARSVGNEENGAGPTVGVIQVAPLSRTPSPNK